MEYTEIEKPLQRRDVLKRLKTICAKLEKWALQKKPVAVFRIKAMRTAIYGYSVAINALKDEEVELRLKELEKKLENSVVIPVDEQRKEKNKRSRK